MYKTLDVFENSLVHEQLGLTERITGVEVVLKFLSDFFFFLSFFHFFFFFFFRF